MMDSYKVILFIVLSLIGLSCIARAEIVPDLVIVKSKKGHDLRGRFDLQYPVLTDKFPNKRIRDKVNATINKEVLEEGYCSEDPRLKNSMKSTSKITVFYASEKILSFRKDIYYSCGGPYTDIGKIFYIFDLRSGKKFDIKGKLKNPNAFTKLLIKKFQDNIPKNISSDCTHLYTTNELSNMYVEYLMANKKLIVSLAYAHVARACEFSIKIPCSQLKAYAKPGSLLEVLCDGVN